MAEILVAMRFDTEDYITPESNDAALALANLLTSKGIRATFPLVGEKARFMVTQGRQDVIKALLRHELGYHSDQHSRHLTIVEELEGLGWLEGVERFETREQEGFHTVARIIDRQPLCYTQPGANWTPHAFPVLRAWGIPLAYSEDWNSYLDMGDLPYEFLGVTTFSASVTALKPFLNRLPDEEDKARQLFDMEYHRLVERGGGLINIVAHPTELVTREYWDVVNFGGGLNRPLSTPALRPAFEARQALDSFGRYLDHILTLPGIRFVSISELAAFGHVKREEGVSAQLLAAEVASQGKVGWVSLPGFTGALTAAETFWLVTRAAGLWWDSGIGKITFSCPEAGELVDHVLRLEGPVEEGPPPLAAGIEVPAAKVLDVARENIAFLDENKRVPAGVKVGRFIVRPEEYLVALSRAMVSKGRGQVALGPVNFLPAKVVKHPERLHWDWPVFPPGFRAEGIRRATVRQTWTIRPLATSNPF